MLPVARIAFGLLFAGALHAAATTTTDPLQVKDSGNVSQTTLLSSQPSAANVRAQAKAFGTACGKYIRDWCGNERPEPSAILACLKTKMQAHGVTSSDPCWSYLGGAH